MKCPSGIKSFYVNAIHYSKSMTIASVPAMWRDEVQAEIDKIVAAEKSALQEKLDKLEEAHQKLEEETNSTEMTPIQQPSDAE